MAGLAITDKIVRRTYFFGVTGLNTWGRAGTSAEAVVEAPLAPGTAVLREENVFRLQAPRIGVCRGNSGDKDERA
jgi:hypothetical protein